jgi:glycosyltransferase involved in cell wall biosynthesis
VFRSSIAADWIVAISEASRRHYLSIFPHFPEDRIRVVYPCSRFGNTVAAGIRPKALSDLTPDGFWLSVGTIEPRKNQRRLAEAYARYLAAGGRPMPLVLAGGNGWLMDDFVRTLEQLGISRHVRMTGYVNDDELIWLYRNCYANLYPSLFEGFGLPLLEGMQFGAASVASNSSSLPEVAADAAILLDPGDTRAWTQCLLHLAANPTARDHWRAAAPAQAARFSERTIAHALLQLYEEAVAKPKRTSPPAGASTPRGRL